MGAGGYCCRNAREEVEFAMTLELDFRQRILSLVNRTTGQNGELLQHAGVLLTGNGKVPPQSIKTEPKKVNEVIYSD